MKSKDFGKTIPLSKTTKFIVDNRGKTAPTEESGIALIATNCVTNDRLYPSRDKIRFVSQATYNSWFRAHPIPGDILLTNKGSQNGAICLVPSPVDFVIAQDMVALRANEAVIDPLYLFAALRSPFVQRQIKNLDVSGVIPHFKKGDFDKLSIPYPDRTSQEEIGRIYFEICRKIELNLQSSGTLEMTARAIFKSWFVDYDPVRAKAEGREPEGMDAATAALFPSEFEESNGCSIPKNWMSLPLDSIAGFLNGLALQKYPALPGEDSIPAIKIAQLKRGSTESADRISPTLPAQYLVRDGDLIFSWSGSLEVEIWCGGDGALNQHLFKVTSEAYPQWFIYGWLLEHLDHFREIAAGKVTTMGHIQRHHLREALVVAPPSSILEKLSATLSPLHDRIIQSRLQIRTLAELRDTLLPRLISGKLRVPEAEKMVEAAL